MPVKAQADTVIYARTLFKTQEQFDEACRRADPEDIRLVVMCNGCNERTLEAARRILMHGEFRCMDCFQKMVAVSRRELAIPDDDGALDEAVGRLLSRVKRCKERPNLVTNFITNLFEPKREMLVHLPSSPAPCQ